MFFLPAGHAQSDTLVSFPGAPSENSERKEGLVNGLTASRRSAGMLAERNYCIHAARGKGVR